MTGGPGAEMLAAAVRIGTPLAIASLGGILSERGGTFAVSLEGQMLAGALAAVLAAHAGGTCAGVVAAALAGAMVAACVAAATVRFGADQMVSGIAANLLALGLTSFAVRAAGGSPRVALLPAWDLGWLARLPVAGPALTQPALTWLGLALVPLLAVLLRRTPWGIMLRATGENPDAVLAAGGSPARMRVAAMLAGGALGGVAGAALALQQVGVFTDGMTSGRGFLALAAIIVGRWHPAGACLACLTFGAAEALQLRAQAFALPVSSYVVQMTPYLLALLVLSVAGRSTRMPGALGRPLERR